MTAAFAAEYAGGALRADPPGLAGHVDDDPASALVHRGQHGMRDRQRAAQVDAHTMSHSLRRAVEEEREAVGAGVV
jgi:hypothetical protein